MWRLLCLAALPALLTLVRGACFVDDLGCCAFDETAAKADDAAKPFCTALCTTDITNTDAPCYVPSAHCENSAPGPPSLHAPLPLQLRMHCETEQSAPPHSGAQTHWPLSQ